MTWYFESVNTVVPLISSKNAFNAVESVPKFVPVTVISVFSTGDTTVELRDVIVIAPLLLTVIVDAALT